MSVSAKRSLAFCFLGLIMTGTLLAVGAARAQQAVPAAQPAPDLNFPTVLYGAAYYNEYMPGATRLPGSTKTSP